MISNIDRSKYLRILKEVNIKHANIFTLNELSYHLKVSTRKLSDFKNGKVIDFWLLLQYAAMIGLFIEFNLNN